MAGESHFIGISLFLMSVLLASDGRHVQVFDTGSSKGGHLSSTILPLDVQSCDAANKQLVLLNGRLQQTSLQNNQLNEEAFGLRSEVRLLKRQLDTCSLIASASSGSYKTHLHVKQKQLLDMFDNDTFLILKVMALKGEVAALQKKVKLAANSTENTTEHGELQRELQEKTTELNIKTQQIIERRNEDSTLILEIISLQNQIWELQQSESRRRGSSLQPDRRVLEVQKELDSKLSVLRSKGDEVNLALLQLISVYSKITATQKMISVHIKEGSSHSADLQRQRKQKIDLLKKKIVQLNRDENNSELTKDILTLQGEILHLTQLIMDAKKSSDSLLEELKSIVEEEKKLQVVLEKQLEQIDYAQTQSIMKIISIMEELREHPQTTPTGGANNPWAQLKDREREFVKAQIEIKDLQQKLQQLTKTGLRPEDRYKQVKLVIEHKMAELNQNGDSEVALILNVINILDKVKALKEQISTSEDQERITELQLHLEGKQKELNTRTAEIEKLSATPRTILQAIELINELWNLQKKPINETRSGHVEGLHDRLDGFISELDDREDEKIKLMLKAILVQSKVEHLQRRLSDTELMLQPSQEAKLTDELKATRKDLENYISGMNEKNQTNIKLILDVTDLQRKLRELDGERQTVNPTTAITVTKLKEQLKSKEKEHAHHQAVIKALQDKLNATEARCSDSEQKVKDLQTNLDGKLKELQSKSPSQTSLALQISQLTVQLEQLKIQLKNTDSKSKVEELQKLINEKIQELDKKTEELKERSPQPERFLLIIAKQVEIEKAVSVASNNTDYQIIAALQDHLKHLINGIQDENTKLTFQIVARRDEVETLKKQEDSQIRTNAKQIKDLENELEHTRNQIEVKTVLLDSSDMRIANLSTEIIALHRKIKPLEDQIVNLQTMHAGILEGLQERLNLTSSKLQDSEQRLKNADANNFDLIKEIVDLKTELKNSEKQTSRDAAQKLNDLDKQLENQQLENRKLERTNKDLNKQVTDLEMCCTVVETQCEDSQRRLQQSQEDADYLQQQLQDKDAAFTQLQQELEEQTRENSKLREEYENLQSKVKDVDDVTIYTPKITLDPNTAHPRIVLSAGNTEISTTDHLRGIQDHPGRYDVVLAVLGTTSFSAGRHYWEVSVKGKNCYHLGMASESAPRKGSLAFKPANGFWTLILNRQGQYKALDGIYASIALETQPATLGILLDYGRGQISFYDAEARSRIYSFTDQQFTDKIYPFINFCVEAVENTSPIVLLSPESPDWIN